MPVSQVSPGSDFQSLCHPDVCQLGASDRDTAVKIGGDPVIIRDAVF